MSPSLRLRQLRPKRSVAGALSEFECPELKVRGGGSSAHSAAAAVLWGGSPADRDKLSRISRRGTEDLVFLTSSPHCVSSAVTVHSGLWIFTALNSVAC